NYAEDGHGPIQPKLKYQQTAAIKNTPPPVVLGGFTGGGQAWVRGFMDVSVGRRITPSSGALARFFEIYYWELVR
ncbi:hypothetical protein, partial [Pseudomonas syringae group genomosp. 7]|uniref:hypothetical protein n=1 Tax=Pseudomonas syringae group genomosp. 7 TaxID=251699 RepID=UPI00376F8341